VFCLLLSNQRRVTRAALTLLGQKLELLT